MVKDLALSLLWLRLDLGPGNHHMLQVCKKKSIFAYIIMHIISDLKYGDLSNVLLPHSVIVEAILISSFYTWVHGAFGNMP